MQAYFDNVRHDRLLEKLAQRVEARGRPSSTTAPRKRLTQDEVERIRLQYQPTDWTTHLRLRRHGRPCSTLCRPSVTAPAATNAPDKPGLDDESCAGASTIPSPGITFYPSRMTATRGFRREARQPLAHQVEQTA
jgi:hypothetical protein